MSLGHTPSGGERLANGDGSGGIRGCLARGGAQKLVKGGVVGQ